MITHRTQPTQVLKTPATASKVRGPEHLGGGRRLRSDGTGGSLLEVRVTENAMNPLSIGSSGMGAETSDVEKRGYQPFAGKRRADMVKN